MGEKWLYNTGIRSFQKLDGENEDWTLDLKKKKMKLLQIQVLSMLM
jgi:hypothetical protein